MKAKAYNMRYLKLYFSFLRINLQRALAYRNNLLFGLFITAVESGATLMTMTVLFRHFPDINGWLYSDMLVLTGTFMITNSLGWLIYRASVEKLDQLINRGDFDYFLVKPISSQFLVSISRIDVEDSARGAVGLVIVALGIMQTSQSITLLHILAFMLALICGEAILYSLQLILKTISFKSVQGWGSNNIFYRLQDTTQFPLTIYRGFARMIFTIIIPVFFVTTVPVQLLLGKANLIWLFWSILAASGALLVARTIWRFTVKSYSSASS